MRDRKPEACATWVRNFRGAILISWLVAGACSYRKSQESRSRSGSGAIKGGTLDPDLAKRQCCVVAAEAE